MTDSGERPSAKGRLTSSGLHPRRGVPQPERLVERRRQAGADRILKDLDLPKEWQASVSKVESCSLAEYDGGRGLETVFPTEGHPKKRCTIICNGNSNELTISLEVADRHQHPSPHILHRFHLPDDDDRMGIRLYDIDVSIEFREHPRNPKLRKSTRRAESASGRCWVVHLETSMQEPVLLKAKRMLRRLESVTGSMPRDWFTYRNYFVKRPLGEPADGRTIDFSDGVFTQTFVGGYTWRFTGNLASTEFQEALTGKLADKNPQEVVPVRVQPFRTAKGKKAAKKLPGKQRRLARVQQRSTAPDEPSQESPKQSDILDDEVEEPELGHQESDNPDQVHPMEGLLGKRTRKGEVQYRVQWTVPFLPTWEPEANVSAESIAEFEKNNADKARRGKGKNKQSKKSTANAPVTRSATKAAKESAK